MNTAIRWRIITLQVVMVVVLAFASGFALFQGAFVTGMVHDQLAAQSIYFPPQSAVVAGGALDPAEFSDISQYAGQQVDNGVKAKAYGNGFIGRHLQKVANGYTYATIGQLSAPINAELANTPKTDPNYAVLQGKLATISAQRDTLFKGEMLRATLLNAWGWDTMGIYVTYAGFFLMIAALVVLGALSYELLFVARRIENTATAMKPATA